MMYNNKSIGNHGRYIKKQLLRSHIEHKGNLKIIQSFKSKEYSHFLSRKKLSRTVQVPDVAAAMVVATPTLAAVLERLPASPRVDPQLNPYHPNQSNKVPEDN